MKTQIALDKTSLLNDLRTMREIRAFDEKVYELVRGGKIKGAAHIYVGQEAVATGAIGALSKKDYITSTHRGHGHCGAIGNLWSANDEERQEHWNRMAAELLGRETGYCKGRGGSMHIADVERGNLGATGIVGGNIPIAVGAALAEDFRGSGAVVLCFFGDGAVANGAFHESVNFAAIHRLPVLFLCENNLYAMGLPYFDRSVPEAPVGSPVPTVAERAAAYGIPGRRIDGMDALAVREATKQALDEIRSGSGPILLEAVCYRYFGHSMSDQQFYRTKEEVAEWKAKDCIQRLRSMLAGVASEQEMDSVEAQAQAAIEAAFAFAEASPFPSVAEIERYVYAPTPDEEQAKLVQNEARLRASVRPVEEAIARLSPTPMPKIKKEQVDSPHPIKLYTEALNEALREEMARDESVFVMGEDIGLYGGAYAATKGLFQEFGARRAMDTPISELAIAGIGAGAAMRGMRPVVEFQYVDFITLASDQIVHNAAYNRFMFGGKTSVPVVYRSQGGVGRCIAAHHSGTMEAWMMHIPGLYVIMPATPFDAKGLLKAAIRSENPVVFLEHKLLYSGAMGPVPSEEYVLPIGVADVKREGKDVTLVAYSRQLYFALAAARQLAEQGIDCEVIDPRSLKPLDAACIANSVRKTGRLVVVSEGFPMCGVAMEIARQTMEHAFENGRAGFDYLDAKPELITEMDTPVPMSEPLEDAFAPSVERIVQGALKVARG